MHQPTRPCRLAAIFAALALAGCASLAPPPAAPACDLDAVPFTAGGATSAARLAASPPPQAAERIRTLLNDAARCLRRDRRPAPHYDVLALSGGGADGAYGAAFLDAMLDDADPATDPASPCVVTGVSTGAVMAPYAFLATSGDPDVSKAWRRRLAELYPGLDDARLLRQRWAIELPFAESAYDVAGMRRELDERVDDELLRAIAREQGRTQRLLLVGATNLRTGAFEVIDLGRLAATGQRACFAEAIRGSAAIPVAFPPVRITDTSPGAEAPDKLYADGGVRHMLFVAQGIVDTRRTAPPQARARQAPLRLFGVLNNTFHLTTFPGATGPLPLMDLAGRSVEIVTDELYHDSAFRADRLVRFGSPDGPPAPGTPPGRAPAPAGEARWTAANRDAGGPAPPGQAPCADKRVAGRIFVPEYQRCLGEVGRRNAAEKQRWKRLYVVLPGVGVMGADGR